MADISVIICTRDRASDLALTLESLGHVRIPLGRPVELLVVDNGSRDHTVEVAKSWRPQPGLVMRYLHVPTPGKGYAYNAGIKAAKGDILLFTDDDVRLPENWIEGMIAPIEGGRADAVAGGVRIAQHLLRPWFTEYMRVCYASTEGINPDTPSRFVGANMCFHRRILAAIPGFDEDMGPGTKYWCHEETLFSWQLVKYGFRLVSAFDIAVEHHISINRMYANSIIRQAYRMGVSDAYVVWHWKQRGPDRYRRDLVVELRRAIPRMPRLLWLATRSVETAVREDDLHFVRRLFYLLQYWIESHYPPRYQYQGMQKLPLKVM